MTSESHSQVKVTFHFFNTVLDEDYVESLWATVVDKAQGHYQLDNVPFFVTSYSLGDIVYAQEVDGELVVEDLVEESGNSTIQIIFLQPSETDAILQKLEALGCDWEGSHLPNYYSVSVTSEIAYAPIKRYLKKCEKLELLAYREACLAHSSN